MNSEPIAHTHGCSFLTMNGHRGQCARCRELDLLHATPVLSPDQRIKVASIVRTIVSKANAATNGRNN